MKRSIKYLFIFMLTMQFSFAQELKYEELSDNLKSLVSDTSSNNPHIKLLVEALLFQKPSLPDDELTAEITETVLKKIDSPEVIAKLAQPYYDHFSDEEVKVLADFYRTEASKKMTTHTPEIGLNLIDVFNELIDDAVNKAMPSESEKTLTAAKKWNSKITSITSSNWEKEIKNSDKPVLLDVYADWCGPCQNMAHRVNKACDMHSSQVKFAKFNVDDDKALSNKLGIKSLPTFLFIREGKVIHKHIGSMQELELERKIKEYLY